MPHDDDIRAVEKLGEAYRPITEQLGRVIVGEEAQTVAPGMAVRERAAPVGSP